MMNYKYYVVIEYRIYDIYNDQNGKLTFYLDSGNILNFNNFNDNDEINNIVNQQLVLHNIIKKEEKDKITYIILNYTLCSKQNSNKRSMNFIRKKINSRRIII